MGYSKEIYNSAQRTLEQRRFDSENKLEKRRNEVYTAFPRAYEIETELSKSAIRAGRAVLNGKNVKEELSKLRDKNLALQTELNSLLIKGGFSPDYLDEKYYCSKCKDKGYIDGKMCDCMKQLLREKAYEELNRLSPLSLCSFYSFSLEYYSNVPMREGAPAPRKRMEDILNFCKKYAAEFSLQSPNLLFQGATGLGKTHLSLAIAREVVDKGFGVIYASAPNILAKLEKEHFSYNKNDIDEESALQHLFNCDLLILDDLGTEFATSYSSATIYNLINTRLMSGKPTIISTNLSIKEIEKNYSERFVSRIMGNNLRIEFLGKDVRQIKRMTSNQRNQG